MGKKAFLGALAVGSGLLSLATNVIGGIEQRKNQRLQREELLRQSGIREAQALSSAYNNQSYVDDYMSKFKMKYGGRFNAKKMKTGGLTTMDGITSGISAANSIVDLVNILSNPAKDFTPVNNDFNYGIKDSLVRPDYIERLLHKASNKGEITI